MAIIYIVTSGEYSDYSINGVFDTKEKAEAFVAYENTRRGSYNRCEIEEWELNQSYDPISKGLTCFWVSFADITKGDATVEEHSANDGFEHSSKSLRTHLRNYVVCLWAKDEASALKIANERRAQFLLKQEQQGE